MIKTGTIQLPAHDPSTGMMGTWDLSAGTGDRSYVSPDIQFAPPWSGMAQPFSSPPTMGVSLAGIDVTGGLSRVRISVETVQSEEFNIRVSTSQDTTLNNVWVTWFADDGA